MKGSARFHPPCARRGLGARNKPQAAPQGGTRGEPDRERHRRERHGGALDVVVLLHKYSDDDPDEFARGPVAQGGEIRTPRPVAYRTGAFTTGRDWWVVQWRYPEDSL